MSEFELAGHGSGFLMLTHFSIIIIIIISSELSFSAEASRLSTHAMPLVVCNAICFAHCVHIYIDVMHIFIHV